MRRRETKSIRALSLLAALVSVSSLGALFLYAAYSQSFFEPTGGFPSSNTDTPLNVGPMAQVKQGALTLLSQLDLSNTRGVNLKDPINPQDAVTKGYVDRVASALGVPGSFRWYPGLSEGVELPFTTTCSYQGQPGISSCDKGRPDRYLYESSDGQFYYTREETVAPDRNANLIYASKYASDHSLVGRGFIGKYNAFYGNKTYMYPLFDDIIYFIPKGTDPSLDFFGRFDYVSNSYVWKLDGNASVIDRNTLARVNGGVLEFIDMTTGVVTNSAAIGLPSNYFRFINNGYTSYDLLGPNKIRFIPGSTDFLRIESDRVIRYRLDGTQVWATTSGFASSTFNPRISASALNGLDDANNCMRTIDMATGATACSPLSEPRYDGNFAMSINNTLITTSGVDLNNTEQDSHVLVKTFGMDGNVIESHPFTPSFRSTPLYNYDGTAATYFEVDEDSGNLNLGPFNYAQFSLDLTVY